MAVDLMEAIPAWIGWRNQCHPLTSQCLPGYNCTNRRPDQLWSQNLLNRSFRWISWIGFDRKMCAWKIATFQPLVSQEPFRSHVVSDLWIEGMRNKSMFDTLLITGQLLPMLLQATYHGHLMDGRIDLRPLLVSKTCLLVRKYMLRSNMSPMERKNFGIIIMATITASCIVSNFLPIFHFSYMLLLVWFITK